MKITYYILLAFCTVASWSFSSQETDSPSTLKEKLIEAVVRQENINEVKRLLAEGVSANLLTERDIPLVVWAVWNENPEMVKLLLRSGVDPNQNNLLLDAGGQGNEEIVKLLLTYGARLPTIEQQERTQLDRDTRDVLNRNVFIARARVAAIQEFIKYAEETYILPRDISDLVARIAGVPGETRLELPYKVHSKFGNNTLRNIPSVQCVGGILIEDVSGD